MKELVREKKADINEQIVNEIREHAIPLNTATDLDPLMEKIGDSKYVLLGEASHGTHEYYTWRTAITQRLIQEKGFSFIAVEGDWPDCYRLNRYIKGYKDSGKSAVDVLHAFNRWPTWMWANWEIVALTEWLREHNENLEPIERVGFYGLDVYSLRESLEAILVYLQKHDGKAYETAKKAAICFEPYDYEGTDYAYSTFMLPKTCEKEVIDLLSEIRLSAAQFDKDHEAAFNAEQNALVARNAEHYYREMIVGGASSWNIRDRHMVDTLERLMKFHGKDAKVIVWEHNTHIGDARATDMSAAGMVNVGELVTEQHEEEGVFKVGFGSYKGTVMAGKNWGDNMYEMNVPEGKEGSWEDLLHRAGAEDKLLLMDYFGSLPEFDKKIDHRAIGVVYHPEREQYGNYVPSIMPFRYDAFIHIDESKALHPLHVRPHGREIPETYPFGV